jgi:hypothetical protein
MTSTHQQHLLGLILINKPTRLQGSSLEPKSIFKNKNQLFVSTICQFTQVYSVLWRKTLAHSYILITRLNLPTIWLFFASLPYSKYAVYQKATQETQNYIGPRIPGIQQHEFRGVHLHVLDREKRKLFFHTDSAINESKQNVVTAVYLYRVCFLTMCELLLPCDSGSYDPCP